MEFLKGACLVGQSGGPTAVINASICGAVETARKHPAITRVFGAINGIEGVLNDALFDFAHEDEREIALLPNTPSAALGSCRYKLKDSGADDTDYRRILEVFQKHDIRYFFYNGGNDSMDTCNKISKYMQSAGYTCRIIGIPKTIDNDLAATDHCPGYGSAAKYIATSVCEVSLDSKAYTKGSVIIFEIMGRNAGWLAAAAALAGVTGEGPDLVYLPERPFDIDSFVEDVREIFERKNSCIVAVSEGVRDADGRFISEYGSTLANSKDAFGHSQMGGLASTLVRFVKEATGYKTRGIELSLLQRCAAHSASKTDVVEAYMAGAAAVANAVAGASDKMVAFERAPGEKYVCNAVLMPLSDVANAEKTVPDKWINEKGNGMTQAFIDYALPLIEGEPDRVYENGLPRFARLKKTPVRE
ncbi:MAG: 6-phosphofructokinase [Oscillospiraceae bacterium]|nr:6-phosphofructokinase [Oscillospiraceae bacterium]